MGEHQYRISVEWTGNLGTGTSGYAFYSRDHEIRAAGRPVLFGSSEPIFRGSPDRYNPEELLVASLSACHMLWYLHLCATNGVEVVSYVDEPEGAMRLDAARNGRFQSVLLRPRVEVSSRSMLRRAEALHDDAHVRCFIANSVNFEVMHQAQVRTARGAGDPGDTDTNVRLMVIEPSTSDVLDDG